MSEQSDFTPGQFGTAIRVRGDIWYSDYLIEFMAQGEPGPRGGAPKRTQVLMTPAQAQRVLDGLTAALAATHSGPDAGATQKGDI